MNVTSTNENDHLFIKVSADLRSEEELKLKTEKVYKEIARYDHKKILIDELQVRFTTNLFQYYSLVESYSKYPPEIRFLRIAIVVSAQYHQIGKFWETVSHNSGFDYHIFLSLEEAIEWLQI